MNFGGAKPRVLKEDSQAAKEVKEDLENCLKVFFVYSPKAKTLRAFLLSLPTACLPRGRAGREGAMRYAHRKANRKTKKHAKRRLSFLEALRLYDSMPVPI